MIENLKINNLFLGDQGMYNLSRGFSKLEVLETLDISCNDLSHFGMEFFINQGLMSGVEFKKDLTEILDVEMQSQFSESGTKVPPAPIQNPIDSHGSLRSLNISDNSIGNRGAEHLARYFASSCCSLIEIIAANCKINMRGAVSLF